MTWTVFEHNAGQNETTDDAPGRGGYTYVLVPLPSDEAIEWWDDEYGENPRRRCYRDKYGEEVWDGEVAWHYREHEDTDNVRRECGTVEMEQGGIGVPMTRYYEWGELKGRLDVRVVTDLDVEVDDESN